MNDKLEKPMQIIQFGDKEIVVPNDRPYITPAQAKALYGPIDSLDPGSVLGALFDLKSEVMQAVVREQKRESCNAFPDTTDQTGKEVAKTHVPTQLDWDFTHVTRFSECLMSIMGLAKEGELYYEEPRQGASKLLGKNLKPLSQATTVLPEDQALRLYKKNGHRVLSSSLFLETQRFLEYTMQFLAVLKKYAPDIGEERINPLLERLADAMNAQGVSSGIAGLLAEGNRLGEAKKLRAARTPPER